MDRALHRPPGQRAGLVLVTLASLILGACNSPSPTPVARPSSTTADAATNSTVPASASTVPPAPPPAGTVVTVMVPAGNGSSPFDVARTLDAPAGATVEVWARVPGARFETWTPAGDLLISVPGTGSIVRLHPGAQGGDPPTITPIVSGLASPQGMAFDSVGGHEVLYVAEDDQIDRYAWTGTGVGPRTVLATLPDPATISGYAHPLKNVVVGPDHTIYVDVASSGNIATDDRTATPPRAVIESFGPGGGAGTVVAEGVRNGDGLAFAPDGALWTAVNERDDIADPSTGEVNQSYVNDHPPDELAPVGGGRDLGWPYCDPVIGPGADPYRAMTLQPDAQTNPGGRNLECSSLPPIERGIPAHDAPLGFNSLEGSKVPGPWQDGAVLGIHGSNDHVPAKAGAVLWLPWEGATLGPAQNLLDGFLTSSGDRWGRPVDALAGPDGSIYVSDDTAGAIYRVTLPGG